MTLYDWMYTLLLPIFGDITALEGASDMFGTIFWLVLSCVVVHFCIYVPYRAILWLFRWRRWGK